jgi:hypothetical protein
MVYRSRGLPEVGADKVTELNYGSGFLVFLSEVLELN